MAWRDKLLIKGLEHSACEYLVVGKAAQPAQERALFLGCWGLSSPRHTELGCRVCGELLCTALRVSTSRSDPALAPGKGTDALLSVVLQSRS